MLLQPLPPGFRDYVHEFTFSIQASEEDVWKWLNDTTTFTDTQIWPYKVEFYSPDPENIHNGFHEGVLTNHFGPFVNFAGILTKITPNYRDLQYTYGSYALSPRWIRPYRLEFSTEVVDGQTQITGRLSTYVTPGWYNLWVKSQKRFWKRFERWSTKSILKKANKAGV